LAGSGYTPTTARSGPQVRAGTVNPAPDFVAAVHDLPLPGGGRTAERLLGLAELGRRDPVLARLGEGHADAMAILAELGVRLGEEERSSAWGVWAAAPQSVTATPDGDGWRLDGDRPWCSGAGVCAYALVTAQAPDGPRLFAVDLAHDGVTALDGTWPAIGMARSDSRTVRFGHVPGRPVGEPGRYVGRPGFWHGGIGVAACWYGGATGIAERLLNTARERDLDPHALAHLGAIDARLVAMRALLLAAAARIDAAPTLVDERLAGQVRAVAEATATEVIDRVGRALGAGPLGQDGEHAARVADLSVYLRQSHAERDLQHLGALTRDAAENGAPPW
jgi:alkylation response protein AidB-like acyl-CoA dehydrogenase